MPKKKETFKSLVFSKHWELGGGGEVLEGSKKPNFYFWVLKVADTAF